MTGTVDYRSVGQGSWSNCWLISALIGHAWRQPDAVLPLIDDLGNGHFRVTFPGHIAGPVIVGPRSPRGGARSEGDWAGLIESAVATIADGIGARVLTFGYGITLLTGNGRTGYLNGTGVGFAPLLTWSRSEWLHSRLEAATRSRRLMIVGGSSGDDTMRIRGSHCYALLSYDPQARTCRLRDPYGDPNYVPPGRQRPDYGPAEFDLTTQELEHFFRALTIEDE